MTHNVITQPYTRTMTANCRGLTLIELMIALAISAFLTLGVTTLYMDSKSTDRLGMSLARVQEGARLALDLMMRDIRMIGYQGCADPSSVELNIIAHDAPTTNFFESALRGYEVTDTAWADGTEFDNTDIETMARIGSDVIAIQRAESTGIEITGKMNVDNANLKVKDDLGLFEKNDVVLISDCGNADMFRISSKPASDTWAHAMNVNYSNRLSALYDTSADIFVFRSLVYFVGDTGRTDTEGNPIYSLYRQTDNLNLTTTTFTIEELVEGVDSLQILYGQRLANGNIRFVPAGTADLNMSEVEAVRIGLLVSSPMRVLNTDDTQTYNLPGESIGPATSGLDQTYPNDRRVRRAFTSNVNIRNRG